MIPSYYPLPREQYLSAIGLQAFHGGYSNTSRKGLEYSIVRHRSVSGEKGDSGRSGVRGGIVKKIPSVGGTTGGRVGAANRTRTGDLRITNASLYQLSYCGFPYIQNEPRCSHRGSYSKKAATYSPTN